MLPPPLNRAGRVDEYFWAWLPAFDVLDAAGQRCAKARLNFWGTEYTVRDVHDDHVIATLRRSYWRVKDDWSVSIVDRAAIGSGKIDPRVLVILATLQSDRDDRRAR